jgi:hypothetical protein
MKYSQAFEKMPIQLLLELQKQPWIEAIGSKGIQLSELLSSVEAMGELKLRMSGAELQVLQTIIMEMACLAFSGNDLEKAAAATMSGAEIRAALVGLRRYGIIMTMRKSWGEQLFILPEDGFSVWHSLLLMDEREDHVTLEDELEPILIRGTSSRGLAQDLFHLLTFAASNMLPLTHKGTLHKKQLMKLLEIVKASTDEVYNLPLTYHFSEIYGLKLAVLIDASLRMRLIQSSAEQLELCKTGLEAWLQLSFEQQQTQLYQLWKSYYYPAAPWLQHCIYAMEKETPGKWCSVESVIKDIMHTRAFEENGSHNNLWQTWISPLHEFGWLELSKDRTGGLWFRWMIETEAAPLEHSMIEHKEPGPCLYVQPDFELLLPPTVPPYVEWEVAGFATLTGSDLVRTYRLTKESFHRACESGGNWEGIHKFLKKYSLFEVPNNVQVTLEQWGKQYGNRYFAEVVLLRCNNVELAQRIAESNKCSTYIQDWLGEMDFLVQGDRVTEFRKQLEQMGVYPRQSVEGPSAKIDDLPTSHEPRTRSNKQQDARLQGLFMIKDPLLVYELDPYLMSMEDIYPNMQEIPSLWLKEYRDYHDSTRKDLIRKAIEWKSLLKLRKEGKDCLIAPRAISENNAGWTLIGREATREVCLDVKEWEAMQLILPGINGP